MSTEAGDTKPDGLPRYGLGALHVYGSEGHVTLLDIGRNGIDNGIGPVNGGSD